MLVCVLFSGPVVEHEAVHTVDAQKKALEGKMQGVLTKNLFLKSKKKKFYLAVVEASRAVNITALAKHIGGTGGFRFAPESSLTELLKVKQGSVTAIAALYDTENKVEVLIDTAVSQATANILLHPMSNTATMSLSAADVMKVLAAAGNTVTEIDFANLQAAAPAPKGGNKQKKQKPQQKKKKEKKQQKKKGDKKDNLLGIKASKAAEFSLWYQQVVTHSEMIGYYDISGCYILRPWSFQMWEQIVMFLDTNIKKLGVKNSYFPLFVKKKALCLEEDHIEGFAPEVAWVTKSGTSDLDEEIAVRPTSETIMYPAFAKWIHSWRDLPLKLNQWSNVVRWEFKCPTPFIRSREFLWQEGHSAFATLAEAEVEVLQILDLYSRVYSELMAVPVVKGKKTEKEKFAGGYYTTTVEAFIPAVGRGIQGATSHCLGQNFAKMFKINFEDEKGEKKMPWQNSWGLTTRTIGVMVMVHGDDKGLVLPPRMAPVQVIIVPIFFKDKKPVCEAAEKLCEELKAAGVRCETDCRDNYNPGWKFNHWELKGVPLRLEVGPRDLENKTVELARRDMLGAKKEKISMADVATHVPALLEQIQNDMLAKATQKRDDSMIRCTTMEQFNAALNKKLMALSPWCGTEVCEENIKDKTAEAANMDDEGDAAADLEVAASGGGAFTGEKLTGAAKSLCVPFDQPELSDDHVCVNCRKKAINWTLFGRSY